MANEDAIYIGELAMPMIKGEKGDKGDQGPQGEQGIQGEAGLNATIAVGSTVTGAAGTEASVENSGTASNAVLNFVVPRGDKGDTGEIISITAVTLESTARAYARNNGTTTDAQIELGIPKGIGIANMEINEDYELIVTLTDSTELNAGSLTGLIPINVSAFTNDAGYITKTDYATTSDGGTIKMGNLLYLDSDNKVKASAISPEAITGANYNLIASVGTVWAQIDSRAKNFVKTTDYAVTNGAAGIIKAKSKNGLAVGAGIYAGELWGDQKDYSTYISDQYFPRSGIICKGTLENVIEGKGLTTKTYVDSLVGDLESILETLDVGSGV
jgi:hypothetical protein